MKSHLLITLLCFSVFNLISTKSYSQELENDLQAKNFKGVDILSKQAISLTDFKGKYVFLDFWGPWCKPCIEEIPNIKKAYQSISSDSLIFIGIASELDRRAVKKTLRKMKIKWYQIMFSENPEMDGIPFGDIFYQGINNDYGVFSWPTTFLIDPHGKIIAKNIIGADLVEKLRNNMRMNQ